MHANNLIVECSGMNCYVLLEHVVDYSQNFVINKAYLSSTTCNGRIACIFPIAAFSGSSSVESARIAIRGGPACVDRISFLEIFLTGD
jgi:hypothetical protein